MTEYYDNLPPIRDMLAAAGIEPKKSLGQNFLLDLNLTDKFARSIKNLQNSVVVEIGGGPAGITRALLANGAKKVIVIELDNEMLQIQKEVQKVYGENRLQLINKDALKKVDYAQLKAENCEQGDQFVIASNLPFNISVHLLIRWLELIEKSQLIDNMTLIFQKEVADRIRAEKRTKEYGRISIMSQLICQVRREFNIPSSAFTPAPKVDATVLQFLPRIDLQKFDFKAVENVVQVAFNQRRKTLKSSLNSLHKNDEIFLKNLEESNIKISARAEELTPNEFVIISKLLSNK